MCEVVSSNGGCFHSLLLPTRHVRAQAPCPCAMRSLPTFLWIFTSRLDFLSPTENFIFSCNIFSVAPRQVYIHRLLAGIRNRSPENWLVSLHLLQRGAIPPFAACVHRMQQCYFLMTCWRCIYVRRREAEGETTETWEMAAWISGFTSGWILCITFTFATWLIKRIMNARYNV